MITFFHILVMAWIVSLLGNNQAVTISFSIIIAAQMICLSLADLLRKLWCENKPTELTKNDPDIEYLAIESPQTKNFNQWLEWKYDTN